MYPVEKSLSFWRRVSIGLIILCSFLIAWNFYDNDNEKIISLESEILKLKTERLFLIDVKDCK